MHLKYRISEEAMSSEDLCCLVRHMSECFPNSGSIIHQGRNCIRVMAINGLESQGIRQVVVKRYHRPNIFQRFDYSFIRHSKARRSFDHGRCMLKRGISTPLPLAFVEEWQKGMYQRSYYVCAFHDGFIFKKEMVHNPQLVKACGHFVARMHQQGIVHGDLNPANILCRKDDSCPDGYQFTLVDINRSRIFKGPAPLRKSRKDFATFSGEPSIFEPFIRQYFQTRLVKGDSIMESILRERDKSGRRYNFLKRIFRPFKESYYRLLENNS